MSKAELLFSVCTGCIIGNLSTLDESLGERIVFAGTNQNRSDAMISSNVTNISTRFETYHPAIIIIFHVTLSTDNRNRVPNNCL